MKKTIRTIISWLRSLRFFVVADPADNSITLSKGLFAHIKANATKGDAKVFVFKIAGSNDYGFMLEPAIEQPTQLCDIQYNGKYKSIGFETLCPSVGQIFYDYGLGHEKQTLLSVSIQKTIDGKIYYQLDRPNDKHFKNYGN